MRKNGIIKPPHPNLMAILIVSLLSGMFGISLYAAWEFAATGNKEIASSLAGGAIGITGMLGGMLARLTNTEGIKTPTGTPTDPVSITAPPNNPVAVEPIIDPTTRPDPTPPQDEKGEEG